MLPIRSVAILARIATRKPSYRSVICG